MQEATPTTVEGSIQASDFVDTTPHISDMPTVLLAPLAPPQRYFRVNWWFNVALMLLLILLGEHTIPLLLPVIDGYLHPKARVTIFPAQKKFSQSYSYLVVTGTADNNQNQIPSRLLNFTTPTKTETIPTTGIGYTQAIQARGTIIFYNEAPYAQTIYAGTVINARDGIQIVTDQTVTIAAGNGQVNGSAQTPAHTIQAGTSANIPPFSINTLCCISGILVKNLSYFTGGQDTKPYPMFSSNDLAHAVSYDAGLLIPLAHDGIQNQIHTNERLLVPMLCSTHASSNPKVGEKATTARVSVFDTCSTQDYDFEYLQQLTNMNFMLNLTQQFGNNFVQSGNLTIATQKITLLDKMHATYKLSVSATGTLIFHLSTSQAQNLKRNIAGKPVTQAQHELLELAGVAGVYIQPAHQNDASLPDSPDQIQMNVSS